MFKVNELGTTRRAGSRERRTNTPYPGSASNNACLQPTSGHSQRFQATSVELLGGGPESILRQRSPCSFSETVSQSG